MSKNNVNPNHYKVAGRARQGEDITQVRHKQQHAESVALRRLERGAASRRTVATSPEAAAAAKSGPDRPLTERPDTVATRKTRATVERAAPGQKRARKPAPGGAVPHAPVAKAGPAADRPPRGSSPTMTVTQAAKKAGTNLQAADKRGKRSTAQKRAASRHDFAAMPATGAVPGAFGKEPSPRRSPNRRK